MAKRNPKKNILSREFNNNIVFWIFILLFLLKIPILNIPFHWDALYYVIPSGFWYVDHPLLSVSEPDFGHPPLFFWILGLNYRIFGDTLIVPHLINLVFSFIGVYFTYILGSFLYSKRVGFIAAVLLFFSPMYFTQSGILNIDIALTSLTIAVLYFALKNNMKLYLLSAVILLLLKEAGIFLIIALFPYFIFKKVGFKKLLLYMSPVVVPVSWLLFYKIQTKSIFYPQHIFWLTTWIKNPMLFFNKFIGYINLLFISNYKFLIAFIVLAYVIFSFYKKRVKLKDITSKGYFTMMLLMVIYILFFSLYDQSLLRHILPTFPIFFIFGSQSVNYFFKKYSYIVLVIFIVLFMVNWTGNRSVPCGCELETNLEYLDLINTHKQACSFIEENYPNAVVLTAWPGVVELTFPAAGYVDKPINAVIPYRKHFTKFDFEFYSPQSNVSIIYYSPQSNVYLAKKQRAIMKNYNLTLLKRFEKNSKYTEIFLVEN